MDISVFLWPVSLIAVQYEVTPDIEMEIGNSCLLQPLICNMYKNGTNVNLSSQYEFTWQLPLWQATQANKPKLIAWTGYGTMGPDKTVDILQVNNHWCSAVGWKLSELQNCVDAGKRPSAKLQQ